MQRLRIYVPGHIIECDAEDTVAPAILAGIAAHTTSDTYRVHLLGGGGEQDLTLVFAHISAVAVVPTTESQGVFLGGSSGSAAGGQSPTKGFTPR